MTTFISKNETFQIAIDIIIRPLACYALEKVYPTPRRTHILDLAVIDALFHRIIMIAGDKVAGYLARKETEKRTFYIGKTPV